MSESWTWAYLGAEGEQLSGAELATTAFPTQSDAESWFGESWHELSEAGVESVSLYRDGDLVYGPMSLHPAD